VWAAARLIVIALIAAAWGYEVPPPRFRPEWQSQPIQCPKSWVYGVAFIDRTNNLYGERCNS
jgi:hypothetical protein